MTTPRNRARTTLLALTGLLLSGVVLTASPSHADPKPLIVVGTSDVSDSNLMKAVIEPGFEKAYPEYDLQYVPKGTGAAIDYAEAGSASALIVHAASLENQFVDEGYSQEKYGRAIFWGDYVLAGPASDPAGVLDGSQHDIVTAFEKIAAAGKDGHATFVSRGSTPGTTVQEHAIWALANSSASLTTCTVTQGDGGGRSPSTQSGDCASPVGNLPSWYYASGKNQGLNVLLADTCPQATFPNGNCYVFTDRGTFNYLDSQDPPAGLANLKILTRDNDPAARGGNTELVNSFHAYAIKPSAVPANSNVDTVGATKFLNWLTSPAGQKAVSEHLDADNDPAFIPSASPTITLKSQTVSATAGDKMLVTGHLANVVPGTPVLNNVPVYLKAGSTTVASATTNAAGDFRLAYVPTSPRSYTVATNQITKIENSALHPAFGDLLAPASVATEKVNVTGSFLAISYAEKSGLRGVRLHGRIIPAPTTNGAVLTMYAAHPGKTLKLVQSVALAEGATTYSKRFVLGKGTWNFKITYANPGVIKATSSGLRRVKLP